MYIIFFLRFIIVLVLFYTNLNQEEKQKGFFTHNAIEFYHHSKQMYLKEHKIIKQEYE